MTEDGTLSRQLVFGPKRIFPGRLAVSRAFGDIEAKLKRYGGIEGVLIADPEIKTHDLTSSSEFIVMICDGIIEQQENEDVIRVVERVLCNDIGIDKQVSINDKCSIAADLLLKKAIKTKSNDNLTSIVISLNVPKKR